VWTGFGGDTKPMALYENVIHMPGRTKANRSSLLDSS